MLSMLLPSTSPSNRTVSPRVLSTPPPSNHSTYSPPPQHPLIPPWLSLTMLVFPISSPRNTTSTSMCSAGSKPTNFRLIAHMIIRSHWRKANLHPSDPSIVSQNMSSRPSGSTWKRTLPRDSFLHPTRQQLHPSSSSKRRMDPSASVLTIEVSTGSPSVTVTHYPSLTNY